MKEPDASKPADLPEADPRPTSLQSATRRPAPRPPKRDPLPSLPALRAFEAYVRLGSMTAAAAELAMPPSSVSRYIAGLQAGVKVRLTTGYRRYVRPTPEGLALAARLTPAFDLLKQAVASVDELPAPDAAASAGSGQDDIPAPKRRRSPLR